MDEPEESDWYGDEGGEEDEKGLERAGRGTVGLSRLVMFVRTDFGDGVDGV